MQGHGSYPAQRIHHSLRFVLFIGLSLVAPAVRSDQVDAHAVASAPRLTAAMVGLQCQSLTQEEARQIVANPGIVASKRPDDEATICARYLLGRLHQLGPDANFADSLEFHELLRDHPQHPMGQLARVKHLLRSLYSTDASTPAERLNAAEALGAGITLPTLQADFHLVIGEAYIFFGDQRVQALRHLLEAERLGIASSATRGTVLVQIGELARLTGNRAQAERSYRTFLADFTRDIRQQIVRDRLAELPRGDGR